MKNELIRVEEGIKSRNGWEKKIFSTFDTDFNFVLKVLKKGTDTIGNKSRYEDKRKKVNKIKY